MNDVERERRRAIIEKSYDLLDQCRDTEAQWAAHDAARNPCAPDPFEARAERLRYEQPQPHWPPLDTAVGQSARDEYVDRRCDQRIASAFGMQASSTQSLAFKDGLLADVIASVIAHQRREMHKYVRDSLKKLKRELAEARAEIRELRQSKTAAISGSVPDLRNYRIALTMTDGKPGPLLNLRPIFERYRVDTAQD